MDNKELIDIVAKRMDRSPRDVAKLLEALSTTLIEKCGGLDIVAIPGFGSFEPKKKLERVTVNPASGKKMLIPPKISLTFKPSTILKSRLR
ncbi:MAG: HU family DNA-binding protein [Muribaculaceae bacterium]|jgi:DNA-binding protein HU-beta|nr:HU family DNA-binding protein [Muribaculaceae bacterium]